MTLMGQSALVPGKGKGSTRRVDTGGGGRSGCYAKFQSGEDKETRLGGREGGETGHVGTSDVTVEQKGLAINITLSTMPNDPLASAPGRGYQPPILVTLGAHGDQVIIER